MASRAKAGGPRTAELRGLIPHALMEGLDAIALADGKEGRMDVLIPVLQRYVDERLHAATLLCRMANINPLRSDAVGGRSDALGGQQ